ncbi:MAG TPA: DUF2071 domain-containing protein, partial [Kofleriaceae bacterium]|nr:DUF2071 domain-containing protein [Kofleriaceae bacterium]
GLTVDTHDGRAYLGIVPFYMRRIRPPFLPPVPFISYFLELNLRTYVHDAAGRPGIWFYSLDCNRALAVWIARWRFHLPYEHAALHAREDAATGTIDYTHHRRGDSAISPGRYTYRPTAPPHPADPGTLEFFLAERYRLFARHRDGRLLTASVHHPPYPLSPVDVTAHDARVIELAGFDAPGRPPDHALYARRVDVTVFKIAPA